MTIALMAFAVCVGFTACSDDDDDNGGGGSSSSSGVKVNVSHGYYDGSGSRWELYFFSQDPSSIRPSGNYEIVVIDLVTDDAYDEVPVGDFEGCFAVDIEKVAGGKETLYESGSRSRTTGKLTIRKSGGKYTVSYTGVSLWDTTEDEYTNDPVTTDASFSYTGSLAELPDYDDDDDDK